ncbi:adipose-secreted signaling protein-like [Anomaloglossus baeobatrachus]
MATEKKGVKPKVSVVHFAFDLSEEVSHSNMHFEEKLHDSVVMVSEEEDSNYLVKLSFLKILHKYETSFTLPALQRLGRNICAVSLYNLNLRVTAITALPEGLGIKCEYTAHKEGVLKKEMILASETITKTLVKVVVQSRVLDHHHGTPMLLEGM